MSAINPPPARLPARFQGDPLLRPFFQVLLRSLQLIFERVRHVDTNGARWTSGDGSPENNVVGSIGDLYTRQDGGANTTLYVKESGTGDTGWQAK